MEQYLGDALLDMLFMIVLTLIDSSETPTVLVQVRRFEVGPRRQAEERRGHRLSEK